VEFAFIDAPEDVIQLERDLLTDIFTNLNAHHGETIRKYRAEPLPSMLNTHAGNSMRVSKNCVGDLGVQTWWMTWTLRGSVNFANLQRNKPDFPQYSYWDLRWVAPLLYGSSWDQGRREQLRSSLPGNEITTGGQRLHRKEDLTNAIRARRINPASFEHHLAMFDLGMPPHGGFAIGLGKIDVPDT
jgi:nondiscriminating aspartyl-tRNA synthetase